MPVASAPTPADGDSAETPGVVNEAATIPAGPPLLLTARQFRDISKAFFAARDQKGARAYLAVLLLLALAVGAVQVLTSYVGRDFMTAIANREADAY
jgi:hypothetical protein